MLQCRSGKEVTERAVSPKIWKDHLKVIKVNNEMEIYKWYISI